MPAMTQPSDIIGNWKLEVVFSTGQRHTLRLEALAGGKGSIQLLVPKPIQIGSNEPAPATWTRGHDGVITLSGLVQFPLGNVGIERGRLVLQGKLERDGMMGGEAKFFPADQDSGNPAPQPSKSGSFHGSRLKPGD